METQTHFFHQTASSRRRENRISRLLDQTGSRITCETAMHNHILNYFDNLFTSRGVSLDGFNGIIQKKVTDRHNAFLMPPFTPTEIKAAMFD